MTFLVAAVNGLWAESILRRRDKPRGSLQPQWIGVAIGLLLVLGYGAWQLGRAEFAAGPRVALLQANIPQGTRDDSFAEGERKAAVLKAVEGRKRRRVLVALAGSIGMLLLAIWLILIGLAWAINLQFQGRDIVLGILAIVAGAFILVDQ